MEEVKPLIDWIHALGYEFYGKRELLIKGMFEKGEALQVIDSLARQGVLKKSVG